MGWGVGSVGGLVVVSGGAGLTGFKGFCGTRGRGFQFLYSQCFAGVEIAVGVEAVEGLDLMQSCSRLMATVGSTW